MYLVFFIGGSVVLLIAGAIWIVSALRSRGITKISWQLIAEVLAIFACAIFSLSIILMSIAEYGGSRQSFVAVLIEAVIIFTSSVALQVRVNFRYKQIMGVIGA